ncbi:hypothetical protein MMC08_000972, partial [Hypocenomyce scalaris]|nr:hypothetical protein [Hypocenomyce scalaris]
MAAFNEDEEAGFDSLLSSQYRIINMHTNSITEDLKSMCQKAKETETERKADHKLHRLRAQAYR